MAGFTNYAYRQIVRDYGGVGLQATEMVNARGFVWLDEHELEHPDRLWGVRDEARPLAVQIWDNDPETMAKVGQPIGRRISSQRGRYQFWLPSAPGDAKGSQRFVPAQSTRADARDYFAVGHRLRANARYRQNPTWAALAKPPTPAW